MNAKFGLGVPNTHAELTRTDEQKTAYALRVYRAVRAEVPAYATSSDSTLDHDFAETNRRNVDLYFQVLGEDRAPHPTELADLEHAARRRLHQAIPLEAIFHSYHVGVRVMWECLLEQADGLDLARLSILTLQYADQVTSAVSRAYQLERERISHSRQEANRLFFTRLFSGDFDDEFAVLREAHSLGYDLSHAHIVVLMSPLLPRGKVSTESDLLLAEARDHLEHFLPESPTVLMRAGVLFAVPGDAVHHILVSVRAGLESASLTTSKLRIGLGTPRTGVDGLISSFHEARRALALGAILEPEGQIYRYDELRFFDLFKEAKQLDAFVHEVLGKLLVIEHERGAHYLETLDELFGAALNRKLAARHLGVHPNTLSYRINRIETLLGGSLLSGEFCFRVQLAIKLLPLSGLAEPKASLDHTDGTMVVAPVRNKP